MDNDEETCGSQESSTLRQSKVHKLHIPFRQELLRGKSVICYTYTEHLSKLITG